MSNTSAGKAVGATSSEGFSSVRFVQFQCIVYCLLRDRDVWKRQWTWQRFLT